MEIIKTDVSDKLVDLNTEKPSYYIEVIFKEDTESFDYLFLKNFYTPFITIKQFDANQTEENNWVVVLDKFKLMDGCETDFDAEKIHLVDKKFFANLNTERLKFLRIYLIQESDKWKNYGLSDVKFIKLVEKDTVTTSNPDISTIAFSLPSKGLSQNNNLVIDKEESNKIYEDLMKIKNQKDINLITFK